MANQSMYGPAFDGSGNIVDREVPDADVPAYVAAGYQHGKNPNPNAPKLPVPKPAKVEPENDWSRASKDDLIAEAERRGYESKGASVPDLRATIEDDIKKTGK